MSGLLLDTNALIWIGTDQGIEPAAESAMNDAMQTGDMVCVSPFVAWEIGLLAARNRIRLPSEPHDWFHGVLRGGGLELAALTPEILIASSYLPAAPPADPADRIMIATARQTDMTLMTRDRAILAYAGEGHVRALAC